MSPLDLTAIDQDYINNYDVIIGADVIYDNDLTDGIITFIEKSIRHSKGRKLRILFTVEKRYVFTIKDLDTVAPSFDYFLSR